MRSLINLFIDLKNFLWSGPLLFLLISSGFYLTWKLRFLQFRYLSHSFSLLLGFKKEEVKSKLSFKQAQKKHASNKGELSSFESVMMALAGAIGTGNISGIAVAISLGGYGSLFWMWVIAFFGMITAYSESVLSVKFRLEKASGKTMGGPMQTLVSGLGMKKTANLFCIFAIIASFGIGGTIQSNSVAAGLKDIFHVDISFTGFAMAFFTGLVVLGGVRGIGKAAGVLVPFMAFVYVGSGLGILVYYWEFIPNALYLIFEGAFTGQGAIGGFLGASVTSAVQQGVSNGIFANEAGMGSLAIAASSAQTKQAARQGMLAIAGVFIASMIVCSITGLVIAVSQVLGQSNASGELLTGSSLTLAAFNSVNLNFGYIVIFGLVFFAFTTILAWAYYGEKCLEFLVGENKAKYYRVIYTCAVFFGVFIDPNLVWGLANLANGLMAIPNLIGILCLSSVVVNETKIYLKSLEK